MREKCPALKRLKIMSKKNKGKKDNKVIDVYIRDNVLIPSTFIARCHGCGDDDQRYYTAGDMYCERCIEFEAEWETDDGDV